MKKPWQFDIFSQNHCQVADLQTGGQGIRNVYDGFDGHLFIDVFSPDQGAHSVEFSENW